MCQAVRKQHFAQPVFAELGDPNKVLGAVAEVDETSAVN
jgi:hypothetical protein